MCGTTTSTVARNTSIISSTIITSITMIASVTSVAGVSLITSSINVANIACIARLIAASVSRLLKLVAWHFQLYY